MNKYDELVQKSLTNGTIDENDIKWIMTSKDVELLPLLHAAYKVRYKYFENKVRIHIINNVKSGNCSEDCSYCAQSKESKNEIEKYPIKAREEILADAKKAFDGGSFRYCMVFSGNRQNKKDMDYICDVVSEIKQKYPMEVCVSAGFLNDELATQLHNAGVNRYNHNLNTSSNYYGSICRSHTYQMRVETINTAKKNGMDVCSGIIIGMGETIDDLINITKELKNVAAKSVPVNFFVPVEGHRLKEFHDLTPEYCLKVLCVFRFTLPDAELRSAGGREHHLRSLQALSLYPANSIFALGYLTTGGDGLEQTKKMITDAGFVVEKVEE
ncbi:MAG: biotin synthase BioB [Spirochaetes bacterium GWD1_27_9]|nr:MAG: biotin synthase BioB [Spirochaetes bacterium GWB1_27_13]OHD27529.1 MAG: biotin synthase BioB [Spirochaetes bacterium GWC1_27_15]OHD32841.1 MAG: biotin synthase BioB [Spirochaetes bacterium GWD1_27_9]